MESDAPPPCLPCQGCGGQLEELKGNWACVHEFLSVAGLPGLFKELHVHTHIGCATGVLRLRALQQLGRLTREHN